MQIIKRVENYLSETDKSNAGDVNDLEIIDYH